jgi:hypothetical protein
VVGGRNVAVGLEKGHYIGNMYFKKSTSHIA